MGAIGDFLSHAAGDASKGVNAATNAAGITSNAGSSMPSTPSVPSGAPTAPVDFNTVPLDPSNLGMPSAPTSGGLSIADLMGQNPQAASTMFSNLNPGINNPYDPLYAQSTPQAQAASIGTPDQSQAPINVTGDGWKPPYQESTLAKVGDFFFHNMFRNRTTQANERDALEHSMQSGQLDPNLAMARLERTPGADPQLGPNIVEGMGRASAYQAMGQQRTDSARDKATSIISNAFGPASPIMQAAAAGKDPDALYQNIRPLLQTMGHNAGLPQETLDKMLPDKFDADTAQTVGTLGTSGFDQARIALEGAKADQEQNYQNQEIDLNKFGKTLQAKELNIHAAEALSTIQKNNTDFLSNKQNMITKSLGPQVVKQLPWLFNGFMTNRWPAQVQTGKLYWAPDKAMVARPMGDGTVKIYKPDGKGKLIYQGALGSSVAAQTNTSGDFAQ